MTKLQGDMESAYSTAGVCVKDDPSNCTLRLDPGNWIFSRLEKLAL